jgi:putative ABC transport system permease protein
VTRTGLVLANLRRHTRRTVLTVLGIAIALFLFVTLRSVLTTLMQAGQIGSESRLVVRNKTGIVFPLPMAYRTRLASIDGVTGVSWSNWFGGVYINERNFFAQFGVEPESYLALYPEIVLPEEQKRAFLSERTAAVVGRALAERFGWKLGQTITLRGTILPGDWPFVIRGIYESGRKGFPDNAMYFNLAMLEQEGGGGYGDVAGTFVLGLRDPEQAAAIASQIDGIYENSASATKTETESAYQLGFVGLWGNIGFFLNTIGMAVVFAILLVAANTMATSARERTAEVAVLKTLGFTDGSVMALVLTEAFVIALAGLVLGLGGALVILNLSHFDAFGFIPGLAVAGSTVVLTSVIAAGVAIASGVVPAVQASRLQVVTALRHVA